MVKWKLQRVQPDTCSDGQCAYLEWWDAEVDPLQRVHTIAAFESVCAAHADADVQAHIESNLMLGFDGNWKPRRAYIEYQQAWFRRLNHVEWLQTHPGEAMPPQIASFTSDPSTTGSVASPAQAQIDGLARAGQRNREHNSRKNLTLSAMEGERTTLIRSAVIWAWTGAGDARVLRINSNGQLSIQQRNRVQSAIDIAFGLGAVIVEG